MGDETLAGAASSKRVQPVSCAGKPEELQEKPRGGSRGAMTRSLSGR